MATPQFWLPRKPYTLIDAYNRMALATGSVRYAMAGENADYNGHHLELRWNSYKSYYVLGYMWSGWNVIARGTFSYTLDAAKRAYKAGARGTTLVVEVREGDEQACANDPDLKPYPGYEWVHSEAGYEGWPDPAWKYLEINDVLSHERHFGGGFFQALREATSPADYQDRCDRVLGIGKYRNRVGV